MAEAASNSNNPNSSNHGGHPVAGEPEEAAGIVAGGSPINNKIEAKVKEGRGYTRMGPQTMPARSTFYMEGPHITVFHLQHVHGRTSLHHDRNEPAHLIQIMTKLQC